MATRKQKRREAVRNKVAVQASKTSKIRQIQALQRKLDNTVVNPVTGDVTFKDE